jgi:hypothetical protein
MPMPEQAIMERRWEESKSTGGIEKLRNGGIEELAHR